MFPKTKKFLQMTWILLRLGIFKLLKWVLRGSLRYKLAEWEGEAKQGFYLLPNLLFEATGKETRSFFLSPLLLSDFSAGREGGFFPYSLLWLRTLHTSKWLPLHNKLEVTWEKKVEKLQFLGSSKTYAPKSVCLYIDCYFQLPRNYMYISVSPKAHCVCCWQEALWLQNTAKIALSNRDIFFSLFSFSPLYVSLPASPFLLSSLHLFLV